MKKLFRLILIILPSYGLEELKKIDSRQYLNFNHEIIAKDSIPDIEDISFFYAPIEFTPKGTRCFFSHVFDHEKYLTDFLPHNLSHLRQFLEYERKEVKSAPFTVMIIRTFINKLKAIKCMDALECYRFLVDLPQLLSHHISPNFEASSTAIYERVGNNYEEIKKWRNNVWIDLNMCLELCHQREKLVELLISKIMWLPKDGEKCWQIFRELYNHLNNIFGTQKNSSYDISWMLVYRFVEFIDLFGSEIPCEVYNKAIQDLDEQRINFNIQQELALGIKTQEKILRRALQDGKINAQARQNFGIITDKITPTAGSFINERNSVQVIEGVS
jgi:hypothetical protein